MPDSTHWTRAIHHDGSALYVMPEHPREGDTVTVRLRLPHDAPVTKVFFQSMWDGEILMLKMQPQPADPPLQWWTVNLLAEQPAFRYRFKLLTYEGAYFYGATGITRAELPESYDFRLIVNYDAPLWVRKTVFYQIFPDRFCNGDPSNDVQTGEYGREGFQTTKRDWNESPLAWRKSGSLDFFGGDLQGITQKLPYLERLGVNGLYLNPIFKASSNHKYDIEDFHQVDKHLGGDDALIALREAMSTRAMRLLLDVTPNHISYQHPWYTDFLADDTAPSAEFFAFTPNGEAETWLGVKSLLKLNYRSERLRDVMYRNNDAILRYWLQPPFAIDGWRLDVANMTANLRMNQLDHDIWREMRPILRSDNPDVYLMGENFFDGTPHTQGDELDAVMNYRGFNTPVRRWFGGEDDESEDGREYRDVFPLPTAAMVEQMQTHLAAVPYPIALQQFNQLDSHDTTRILHVTNGDVNAVKVGIALLMAFPGVPCLYYGTEIEMPGGRDPDNRRPMPWKESNWNMDLFVFCQQWIQARRNSSALQNGSIQFLYGQGDTVAFVRQSLDEWLLFVGYRGKTPSSEIRIPLWQAGLNDDVALTNTFSDVSYPAQDGILTLPQLAPGIPLLLKKSV